MQKGCEIYMMYNSAVEQAQDERKDKQEVFKIGTVTALFPNGNAKIKFDGESIASQKKYSYISTYTAMVNDRVMLARVSGTWVILGKIKYNI